MVLKGSQLGGNDLRLTGIWLDLALFGLLDYMKTGICEGEAPKMCGDIRVQCHECLCFTFLPQFLIFRHQNKQKKTPLEPVSTEYKPNINLIYEIMQEVNT